MKKALAMTLALAMVFSLAACGGSSSGGSSAGGSSTPSGSSGSAASTGSSGGAETSVVPENLTAREQQTEEQAAWNDISEDELYEMAKAEGNDIVVYAVSSRVTKACDSFNEAFPGLNALAYDLDQDEAVSKVQTEAETGNVTADILQCKDVNGDIFYDFVPLGYVEHYFPTDICEHIDDNMERFGMPYYTALNYWYYNTDQFPDGAPIESWWQIVEKDESGNQKFSIVCKEIGQESAYLSLFASFIAHADEMAQAYKDLYGTDLEYTYDASAFSDFVVPENNAGYEFMWRFSQQKMTFISDGDEIVQAVAAGVEGRPTLGLASAGKISARDDDNLPIAWCTMLTPYTGIENTNFLYVVSGTDSPAGARLFIRYMLGDGFKALCKEGNWSVRDDFVNEKNPFPFSEANCLPSDLSSIYNEFLNAQDAWMFWLNQNPNM